MSRRNVIPLLRRRITPELYRRIRQEWMAHSIAEDSHNIPGLLATLTEDCVYEVVNTGTLWRGHTGAAQFYTHLLSAFPDIHFDLKNIVIGPQGVFEEAHVTGTHVQDWLTFMASGQSVEFDVNILFPWDLERAKFTGERVYFFNMKVREGKGD